jgi:hypothetical protein
LRRRDRAGANKSRALASPCLAEFSPLVSGYPGAQQVHATPKAAPNALFRERKILFNPCSLVSAPRCEPKEKVVLDRYEAKRLMEMAEGKPSCGHLRTIRRNAAHRRRA